jgi:hypothetical protein
LNFGLVLHQQEDDNETDEKEYIQDKKEKRVIPRAKLLNCLLLLLVIFRIFHIIYIS